MGPRGAWADEQVGRDLAVGLAHCDMLEDLELARREAELVGALRQLCARGGRLVRARSQLEARAPGERFDLRQQRLGAEALRCRAGVTKRPGRFLAAASRFQERL